MRALRLAAMVACASCAPAPDGPAFEACKLKVPPEVVLAFDAAEGDFQHEGSAPCLLERVEVASTPPDGLQLSDVPKTLQPNVPVLFTVTRTTQQELFGQVILVPQSGQAMIIPVRDLIALPDCFSMSPASLEFDRVHVGCVSGPQTTTITNACELPVRWSHAPLGSDFELEGGLGEYQVLGPRKSQTLSFRFHPVEEHGLTEAFQVEVAGRVSAVTLSGDSLGPREFEDVFVADGTQIVFALTHRPGAGSAVQVTVGGQPATGWQYDSAHNAIQFTTAPPANARISVTGDTGC